MEINQQLQRLKLVLGSPSNEDELLQYYLDVAKDIICDIRHTDEVEPKYKNIQIEIAVELYNKRGAEGQTSHNENGISRSYENASVSDSLLSKIIPFVKTPFSTVRVVGSEES